MAASGNGSVGTARYRSVRALLEALTLVLLLVPVACILFYWQRVPVKPLHLRGTRQSLFILPGLAVAAYLFAAEFGLFAHMDLWRRGSRLLRFKPTFLLYILTLRLEVIAFFAVLSFGMLRAAMTGLWWPAKPITAVALPVIGLTIVLFIGQLLREARRPPERA